MAQERSFTLIGNFKDNITPGLKKVSKELESLQKSLSSISGNKSGFSAIAKSVEDCTSAHKKITEEVKKLRLEITESHREFSKYNSVLSQTIAFTDRYRKASTEVLKANRDMSQSSSEAAKAEYHRWESATRSMEDYVKASAAAARVGGGAGSGSRGLAQNGNLLTSMLQANAFIAIGDGIAEGFSRGMNLVMKGTMALPSFFMKHFKAASADEMSDIKAQAGMMGSLGLAGYKGGGAGGSITFGEAGKFYKKIDQAVAEEIRTSAAPTGTVIELQRFTSDTLVPLLMKAQGIEKGSDVGKVDPKKISDMSKGYASLLGQVALLAQGTGTATFRVAQGVEGLISRGKIDTTMDFFTDNVLLMNALQKEGFAGGVGGKGKRVSSLLTEADRLKALKKALQVAMPKEGIEAMSTSLTGSLQALGDTISNPSVGLFGMAGTFTEKEQKRVNSQLKVIFDRRMEKYGLELSQLKDSGKRDQMTLLRIKQLEIDRRKNREQLANLTKEGEEKVTTPFKAFSLVFGEIVRNFTNVLSAIGPVWNRFTIAALDITDKIMGPLATTLGNIASDMNKDMAEGKDRLPFHVGRVVGEVYKFLGDALSALSSFLVNPRGPLSGVQSEFYKGFLAAFKNNPQLIERAKKGIIDGITALLNKLREILVSVLTAEEIRPLVLVTMAAIFGPPLAMAVITGLAPLMVSWFVGMLGSLGSLLISRLATTKAPPISAVSVSDIPQVKGLLPAAKGTIPSALPSASLARVSSSASSASFSLRGLGAIGQKVGPLISKSLSSIGKLGGVILTVTTAFSVFADLLSGKDIYQSLGNAAPTLVGTLIGGIFGPVGAIIGGLVGNWLGQFKPVTDFFEGVFRGLGSVMSTVIGTFGPILRSLGGILVEVFHSFKGIFDALTPIPRILSWVSEKLGFSGKKLDAMQATIIAVKVAMFPLVGTLFLVEAGLQGLRIALGYANLKVLELRQFVNKLISGGREDAGINKEIQAARQRISAGQAEFATSHERRMQYFQTPKVVGGQPSASMTAMNPLGAGGQIAQISNSAKIQSSQLSSISISSKAGSSNLSTIKTSVSPMPNKLDSIRSALMVISSKMDSVGQKLAVLDNVKSALMNLSSKLDRVYKVMTSGGIKVEYSLGTGPAGGVDSFNPVAQSFGLQMTSGFRPGDPGWHGANRARDYSNSSGPTPQMMSFARYLAAKHGGVLKELIYTPLGFSIKNGRIVPPLAPGGHYNHVHVAYGMGAGSPAFFSSSREARSWERKMAPRSSSIATVTSNSSEGFGGNFSLHSPITIYQQPNQDPEELAALVAMRLSLAVEELRSHI